MSEIPAEMSVETTGWLTTLAVAVVFVAVIAILSYVFDAIIAATQLVW